MAPKPTTSVTNPLTDNLDAAGHDLVNARMIVANANVETTGYLVGSGVVTGGNVQFEPPGVSVITVQAGADDPSVNGVFANPGSLYLRGNGEAWLKTGTASTDWRKLALT